MKREEYTKPNAKVIHVDESVTVKVNEIEVPMVKGETLYIYADRRKMRIRTIRLAGGGLSILILLLASVLFFQSKKENLSDPLADKLKELPPECHILRMQITPDQDLLESEVNQLNQASWDEENDDQMIRNLIMIVDLQNIHDKDLIPVINKFLTLEKISPRTRRCFETIRENITRESSEESSLME